MSTYKILVVDDSPFMCKVFSDFISADPAFEVAGTASNGTEAVERALALAPDIVTMDLEMPQMNGLEALKRLMAVRPTPVIMISAVTDNGTRDTIRALQYGAIDFIRKPDQSLKLDIRQVGEQLLEKLHMAAEMVQSGSFRMLPAIEEEPPETEAPAEKNLAAEKAPDNALSNEPASGTSAGAAAEGTEQRTEPATPGGLGTDDRQAPSAAKRQSRPQAPAASVPPPAPAGKPGSVPKPDATRRPSPEQAKAPSLPKPASEPANARLREKAPVVPPRPETAAAEPKGQRRRAAPQSAPAEAGGDKKPAAGSGAFGHLVAIGTSTGGPRALHEVLTNLPAEFPAPVLVVQHMPPKFTKSLAQRLDSFSRIRVCEAQDGDIVEAGTAYIAPGGKHMTLAKSGSGSYRIALTDEEPRSGHKPSVDRLFESLVGLPNLKRHIVLMTGMGSDGAKGMKALRDDGAETTIAESERTCIVYGMPRSAVEIGAASRVLELQRIAPALVQEVIALKS